MSLPAGLTLVFVAAKLFGVIDWSWWWVVSPIFIAAIVVVIVNVIAEDL